MRIASSLALVLLLAAGAAAYWSGAVPVTEALGRWRDAAFATVVPTSPAAAPPAPVAVTVATVSVGDVPILLSGIGTVQAFNSVAVKSRVDGEIIRILFREGQDVQAGDPLAIIDPRTFEAQLAQARAMRAKDQATLDGALLDQTRYATLMQRDFASRQQVDQQRTTVDQMHAQLQADDAQIAYAQTQLGYATIRAPLSGRVGIRLIDQGNFVHANDNAPLVTITQLQPISVVFSLPASAVAASHLKPGQIDIPVTALAADDTTVLDQGTVELVDNAVDPSTGTIKLKASFPNTAMHLWPGDFVNGRLVVDTRKGAITVPANALRHGPRGDFVWLVQANGTVRTKTVVVGQATNGHVLIEKGLERGADVVTEGHYRLEDDSRIEVVRDASAPSSRPTRPTRPKPSG